MAASLANAPQDVLQSVVEAVANLYAGVSVGISIIEEHLGDHVFRWHALTGPLAQYRWETTPRDFSPCGTVIDRKAVQLMILPERHFAYIAYLKPQVVEVLLIPFSVREQLVGTVWLVSHDRGLQFDVEDEQTGQQLARVASEAYQVAASVEISKVGDRRTDQLLSVLASELCAPATGAEPVRRASKTAASGASGRRRGSPNLSNACDFGSKEMDPGCATIRWSAVAPGGQKRAALFVQRMRAGDQRALNELRDCTLDGLHALASTILKVEEDAEEVVSETYAQAWRQSERYDPERGSPIGWLMMICRSRALDRLRRSRARAAEQTFDGDLESLDGAPAQEDVLALFDEGSRLRDALALLSADRVRILRLAYFEGLSAGEIARRTQTPLGTVKSHIRRGLAQLRRTLEARVVSSQCLSSKPAARSSEDPLWPLGSPQRSS